MWRTCRACAQPHGRAEATASHSDISAGALAVIIAYKVHEQLNPASYHKSKRNQPTQLPCPKPVYISRCSSRESSSPSGLLSLTHNPSSNIAQAGEQCASAAQHWYTMSRLQTRNYSRYKNLHDPQSSSYLFRRISLLWVVFSFSFLQSS